MARRPGAVMLMTAQRAGVTMSHDRVRRPSTRRRGPWTVRHCLPAARNGVGVAARLPYYPGYSRDGQVACEHHEDGGGQRGGRPKPTMPGDRFDARPEPPARAWRRGRPSPYLRSDLVKPVGTWLDGVSHCAKRPA